MKNKKMLVIGLFVLMVSVFVSGCKLGSTGGGGREYIPPKYREPTMYITIDSEYDDPNSRRMGLLLGKEYDLKYSMKNAFYPRLISMNIDFPKEFKVTGDYTEWKGTADSNDLIFKITPQEKGFFEVKANTMWTNSSFGEGEITYTIGVYVDTDIETIKKVLDVLKEKDALVPSQNVKSINQIRVNQT